MRVLHITDHLPDYHSVWGGAEKVALRHINLSSTLIGKNKTYVATTKPIKKVSEKFKHLSIFTLEELFPKRLQPFITGFKNNVFPFDPFTFISLLVTSLKYRPQIIHIYKTNKISLTPILVGKLLNIPTILSIMDYWYVCPGAMLIKSNKKTCHEFHGKCKNCMVLQQLPAIAKIAYPFRKPLFNLFLNRVSAFSVLSQSNKNLFLEYGIKENKIFIIRQVFNISTSKTKVNTKKYSILLNAWMAFHKGPHIAVEALSHVVKKFPKSHLYLHTKSFDPIYEQKVYRLIKKYNLKKNITIMPKQPLDKYLEDIRKSHVVLITEQWENMAPTTLADALSFSKPVVATRLGGIPEMVHDGVSGILAEAGNPKSYADGIMKLFSSPSLTAKIQTAASINFKKLASQKRIQSQIKTMYQALLSTKSD